MATLATDMPAAVFQGGGRLELIDRPAPGIRQDRDVLLQVDACGICGTDVHILATPPGHPATEGVILGHEYTGQVLEVGPGVTHLQPGDRVVVDPNLICGLCDYCRMGLPNMCANMTALGIFRDGGFTRYNVAPAESLHKIAPDLPAEIAAFAEPLACVVNGTQQLAIQPGESVVILGAGPIGLLFTQVLRAAGAGTIIVAEISEYRGHFAKKSGAHVVVNPQNQSLADVVKAETRIGADAVVDCVGTLLAGAIPLARRGGKILLFGMDQHAQADIRQNAITRDELHIMGSYIARHSFPPAIRMLERGVLRVEDLLTHRLPLAEIHSGIEAMRRGEAIKVSMAV